MIEKENFGTRERAISTRSTFRNLSLILVLSVLVLALIFRLNTFWLNHWSGDQENYIALAMKLDKFGFGDYNLRSIDVREERFALYGGKLVLRIGEVLPAKAGDKGYFLEQRQKEGIIQYDIPLYYMAPGFPYALMSSHRLFAKDRGYTGAGYSLNRLVRQVKPVKYFRAQFYAAIVPLLFSLILIFLTFLLGRELFSNSVGFYASFMMAANAIDIVCAQRIWPASMVSALLALSILVFISSVKRDSISLSFFSGVILGLSILTRQNVVLILAAIWFYQAFCRERRIGGIKGSLTLFFNREMIPFLLGASIVSSFWFIKVFQTYGTPIYDTAIHLDKMIAATKIRFYKEVLARPPILILYAVGIPYLSPIFSLAYFTLKDLFVSIRGIFTQKTGDARIIFLWVWICVFALYLAVFRPISREHRYLLPVYPAIAILSAYVLTKIKAYFLKKFGAENIVLSEILIMGILILSAWWSVPLGIDQAITNKTLILKPF